MESLAGIRVLVVDDDDDAIAVLDDLLRSHDAEVATATSNERAVELLPVFAPDVILSDLNMPEGDGYQLMRMVRARTDGESAPVVAIALTASREAQDRTRALLAGFSVFLTKPVDATQLCESIKRAARTRVG